MIEASRLNSKETSAFVLILPSRHLNVWPSFLRDFWSRGESGGRVVSKRRFWYRNITITIYQ